jgi:hypothetical protein
MDQLQQLTVNRQQQQQQQRAMLTAALLQQLAPAATLTSRAQSWQHSRRLLLGWHSNGQRR